MSYASRALRSVSLSAAAVPSLAWGMLYLLSIPVFAAIYTQFAGEFFHGTAVHESSVAQDRAELEDRLRNSIITNFKSVHGESQQLAQGFNPHVRLSRLSTSSARQTTAFAFETMGASVTAKLVFADYESTKTVFYKLDVSGNGAIVENPHATFPCPFSLRGSIFKDTDACMSIDFDTSKKIETYLDSLDGFPSALSGGHFWRMLYFSAVTITTLGYGDIVPLTTRARIVVTAQVIWGPLAFGLFLNSLAYEGRNDRKVDDEKHRSPG
jgi:hypothetical protein